MKYHRLGSFSTVLRCCLSVLENGLPEITVGAPECCGGEPAPFPLLVSGVCRGHCSLFVVAQPDSVFIFIRHFPCVYVSASKSHPIKRPTLMTSSAPLHLLKKTYFQVRSHSEVVSKDFVFFMYIIPTITMP